MDKDQIEAIKARLANASDAAVQEYERRFPAHFGAWAVYRVHRGDDPVSLRERMQADAALITHARADIDALIADNERLAALLEDARRERDQIEAEVSVYRITVLGVNVAAGQGED